MVPAFSRLVDASASDEFSLPNGEPSDMLTTFTWSASARSKASTTTLVEPVQPKTRYAYRSALGATPGPILNDWFGVLLSYVPVYCAPALVTPNPAVVPPTWLPWPLQSSGLGSSTGAFAGSLLLASYA